MDKRRTRIISFRLSPEEYEFLKKHSKTNGSRSISEFTRSAACRSAVAGNNVDAEKLDNALESLNNAINKLGRQVHRLSRILRDQETLEESDTNALNPNQQ